MIGTSRRFHRGLAGCVDALTWAGVPGAATAGVTPLTERSPLHIIGAGAGAGGATGCMVTGSMKMTPGGS